MGILSPIFSGKLGAVSSVSLKIETKEHSFSGADDNAAAVEVLLDLPAQMPHEPLERPVILAFSTSNSRRTFSRRPWVPSDSFRTSE